MTAGKRRHITKWTTLPKRALDTVRSRRIRSVAGISVRAAVVMLLTAAFFCFFTPFLSVISTNAKDVVTETHTGWSWMTTAGMQDGLFYAEWGSKLPVCNPWLVLAMLCNLAAVVLMLSRMPRRYAAGCCGAAVLLLLCFRVFFRLDYRLGNPKLPELMLSSDAHAGLLLCMLFLLAAGLLSLAEGENI